MRFFRTDCRGLWRVRTAMDREPATRHSLLIRLRDVADERAWEEFVDIYGPFIRASARRRGLQAADAEDLAQDVFRVVASAIERGDYDAGRGKFRAWLFRIARNLAINALIARGRHPRGTGDTGMLRWLEERPLPSADDSPSIAGGFWPGRPSGLKGNFPRSPGKRSGRRVSKVDLPSRSPLSSGLTSALFTTRRAG
jgi:hypothetical protein